MSTLIFVCPVTRLEVVTGLEMDQATFAAGGNTIAQGGTPRRTKPSLLPYGWHPKLSDSPG